MGTPSEEAPLPLSFLGTFLTGIGSGRVVQMCWVNFPCRSVLLIWIIVGQGPIVLATGAGGGCLDIFSLNYHFSFLSPSLWETARYRLKYCLKGPLNPEQPTKPTHWHQLSKTDCSSRSKDSSDLLLNGFFIQMSKWEMFCFRINGRKNGNVRIYFKFKM